MLGYVTIEKGELKIKEYDVYQAYYCGICKAIGSRCGQLPRMTLSYDSVFLALVLSGLSDQKEEIVPEHCIIHPVAKKPVLYGSDAVSYAADVMVILAYHKFLDDWKDEHSPVGFAGKGALYGAYRKLRKRLPSVCAGVEDALSRLSALEKENSGSLDKTSDAFADVMEVLFTGFDVATEEQNRILAAIGRSLGKWIYIIDAADDYEKDCREQKYNPFRFRENNLEGAEILLYNYLAEVVNAYDLLDIKKNREIIENIIFMGLRRRTDTILQERTKENEQSI